MSRNADRFGAFDILRDIVDKDAPRRSDAESLDREPVDRRIRLHQFFGARHDNIAKSVEYWLRRAETLPKFMAEICDHEQGYARGIEPLDEFEAAGDRRRDRLVETRGIGV